MRHKITALLLVLALFLAAPHPQAAGSTTVSASNRVYTVQWTSDGSGAVSAHTFTIRRGTIAQVKVIPGSGGVQPTDMYDVTVLDANGIDILAGNGMNLSNAAAALLIDIDVLTEESPFDVVVANAGAAKQGTVMIWLLPPQTVQ